MNAAEQEPDDWFSEQMPVLPVFIVRPRCTSFIYPLTLSVQMSHFLTKKTDQDTGLDMQIGFDEAKVTAMLARMNH